MALAASKTLGPLSTTAYSRKCATNAPIDQKVQQASAKNSAAGVHQKSNLASPHLKQNAALALLAAAAVVAYYLRRRSKRRQQAAKRHARDLLCDPRIKRSLVPYPSKDTTRRLATLTGLSAQQVRHIARSARSGRCARPWHGEAPAQKRRETFARRRHFYFALHKLHCSVVCSTA